MKTLLFARGYWAQTLPASAALNRLLEITQFTAAEEANSEVKNASTPYNCLLAITNDYAEAFDRQLTGCDGVCRREAAVTYLHRRDMALPRHHAKGVFSLYEISKQISDGHGKGDDQWVFEYHAPCRKRSSQWGGLASLESPGGRVEMAPPVRPAPSSSRMDG